MVEQLMTISQIVSKYHVSRKTVQRWMASEPPKISPVQTLDGPTGPHLFTAADVEEAFGPHLRRRQARQEARAAADPAEASTSE